MGTEGKEDGGSDGAEASFPTHPLVLVCGVHMGWISKGFLAGSPSKNVSSNDQWTKYSQNILRIPDTDKGKSGAVRNPVWESNDVLLSLGCSHFVWANMIGADKTVFRHPVGNPLRSSQLNGTVHAISDLY